MLKKNFIFLLLLLLSSCGYEAIHSKKNSIKYNFSISEISFVGDREINLKIKERINNYKQKKKNRNFILKIFTVSEKVVLAKDTSGDATSFKNTISINVEILMNNKLNNNFVILESFNYNNVSNKFDLKRYEKEIKNNLAEAAADKLIFRLSNLQ